MTRDLTIGQTARATGIPVQRLRYYEKRGLVARPPRVAGRRLYGPDMVEWLRFVVRMREAGLSLANLARLTRLAAAGDATLVERRAIVAEAERAAAARIAALTEARQVLQAKLATYDAWLAGAAPDRSA